MIYSGADANFKRVILLYNFAKLLHNHRNTYHIDENVIFDLAYNDALQKENAIVESILIFTVGTIESLVNYAIANKINNLSLANLVIEYPREVHGKLKFAGSQKHEISMKIAILADEIPVPSDVSDAITDLIDIRNNLTHDKPFYMRTEDDGEVTIKKYGLRNPEKYPPRIIFEKLNDKFLQAQKVVDFIKNNLHLDVDIDFTGITQS
jgi:hypothetical protein